MDLKVEAEEQRGGVVEKAPVVVFASVAVRHAEEDGQGAEVEVIGVWREARRRLFRSIRSTAQEREQTIPIRSSRKRHWMQKRPCVTRGCKPVPKHGRESQKRVSYGRNGQRSSR